jgi:hypothetical protein
MRAPHYKVSIRSAIVLGQIFLYVLQWNVFIDGKCLCPGKEKWPVIYEKQRFCGKELNLWHSPPVCKPEVSYSCTRDQVEATVSFDCKDGRHNFCGPVLPEGCDDSDTRSLYNVCMRGRTCKQEQFAERGMELTYGKNPQKSKNFP